MTTQAKFDKKMRELYAKYLKHCKKTGIAPAPFPHFKIKVEEKMAQMTARALAEKVPKKDQPKALYVTMRQADMEMPIGIRMHQGECGRCREPVWLDPAMADKRMIAAQIVCNHCVSSITGKKYNDIIKDELKKL